MGPDNHSHRRKNLRYHGLPLETPGVESGGPTRSRHARLHRSHAASAPPSDEEPPSVLLQRQYRTVEGLASFKADALCGAGTRVWICNPVDKNGDADVTKQVVVKDGWAEDGRPREGDIYRLFREIDATPKQRAALDAILPTVECDGDVYIDGEADITAAIFDDGDSDTGGDEAQLDDGDDDGELEVTEEVKATTTGSKKHYRLERVPPGTRQDGAVFTQVLKNKGAIQGPPNPLQTFTRSVPSHNTEYRRMRHYRIALCPFGTPLTKVTIATDLFNALIDVIKGGLCGSSI